MSLVVQTSRRAADFAALATEWDAIAAAQVLRTPFQSSTWHRLWWRHYRRQGTQVRDVLRLFAVRDSAGSLVAVAPMMLTHRPAGLPIRTRELQFLGADTNVTEMRGMICLPGREASVLAALVEHIALRPEWDWIQWRGLPGEATPHIPGFQPRHVLEMFYLPLPDSWQTLQTSLSRNMKEALRKCYNSLARDKLEFHLHVVAAPDELAAALPRLLELHAMRAAVADTIRHPDVFASPRARAFLFDCVGEMAATGKVRLFVLKIAGVAVAMRLGFILGNALYFYYSGYDPAWGKYSVMTTLVAEAIKWAISQGYAYVNLSTGSDPSKARWRPARVEFVEGVQPSARWRGQLALAAMDMVRPRIGSPVPARTGPMRPVDAEAPA